MRGAAPDLFIMAGLAFAWAIIIAEATGLPAGAAGVAAEAAMLFVPIGMDAMGFAITMPLGFLAAEWAAATAGAAVVVGAA